MVASGAFVFREESRHPARAGLARVLRVETAARGEAPRAPDPALRAGHRRLHPERRTRPRAAGDPSGGGDDGSDARRVTRADDSYTPGTDISRPTRILTTITLCDRGVNLTHTTTHLTSNARTHERHGRCSARVPRASPPARVAATRRCLRANPPARVATRAKIPDLGTPRSLHVTSTPRA